MNAGERGFRQIVKYSLYQGNHYRRFSASDINPVYAYLNTLQFLNDPKKFISVKRSLWRHGSRITAKQAMGITSTCDFDKQIDVGRYTFSWQCTKLTVELFHGNFLPLKVNQHDAPAFLMKCFLSSSLSKYSFPLWEEYTGKEKSVVGTNRISPQPTLLIVI